MAGQMIEVGRNGSTVPAYLATPAGGKGPGVVVIQEWWGLVPHIKHVADRLAGEGFVALAPDLYHGVEATEPDEAQKLAMGLRIEEALKDLNGAIDYLLHSDAVVDGKVGVIGFCMGGGVTLALAAARPEVAAAVPFYGMPQPSWWDPAKVKGAVLGHYAEHDHYFTPEIVGQMAERLRANGVDVTIYNYPGTDHAFFNDDRPEVYNAEAAQLAWQRSIEFLHTQLG
jgi:carboxymethylenebutenolidase